MNFRILILGLASSALLQTAAADEALKEGGLVPAFQAQDQHEQAFDYRGQTRFLLLTFDMDTGKSANAVLTELGGDYLKDQKTVYVANIHGMPAIGRFFALRKMRKYSHRIVLSDKAGFMEQFPRQEKRATLLKTAPDRTIQKILFWNPEAENAADVIKNLLENGE